MLDPTAADGLDVLDMKLSRWPAMVVAGTATDAEFEERKNGLITYNNCGPNKIIATPIFFANFAILIL